MKLLCKLIYALALILRKSFLLVKCSNKVNLLLTLQDLVRQFFDWYFLSNSVSSNHIDIFSCDLSQLRNYINTNSFQGFDFYLFTACLVLVTGVNMASQCVAPLTAPHVSRPNAYKMR